MSFLIFANLPIGKYVWKFYTAKFLWQHDGKWDFRLNLADFLRAINKLFLQLAIRRQSKVLKVCIEELRIWMQNSRIKALEADIKTKMQQFEANASSELWEQITALKKEIENLQESE